MDRDRQPTTAYRRMRPGAKRQSWVWPAMITLPVLAFAVVFLWGGHP